MVKGLTHQPEPPSLTTNHHIVFIVILVFRKKPVFKENLSSK